MKVALTIVAALITAAPAAAEVVSSNPNGFHIRHSVEAHTPPQASFAAFGEVARWWDPKHTYSGDAGRLTLKLAPGGCFCESLPTGGIEHLRVAYVDAPKRLVLTGALGPLLYEAAAGVMDVKFEAGSGGSRLVMDYKAAGFASGGADKLAPVVDKVLAQQMRRFEAFARKR